MLPAAALQGPPAPPSAPQRPLCPAPLPQDLVHTIWAYGQLSRAAGPAHLAPQCKAFIDLLAAEVPAPPRR
jgi:hypothetical protein